MRKFEKNLEKARLDVIKKTPSDHPMDVLYRTGTYIIEHHLLYFVSAILEADPGYSQIRAKQLQYCLNRLPKKEVKKVLEGLWSGYNTYLADAEKSIDIDQEVFQEFLSRHQKVEAKDEKLLLDDCFSLLKMEEYNRNDFPVLSFLEVTERGFNKILAHHQQIR